MQSDGQEEEEKRRKLKEKMALKRLSIAQDLADAVMALADIRDGKGAMTEPALVASAGLLSALISAHKNWNSC
ncbi:peroxisomal membrane protein 11A [Iris pallida]|uniref:Peroxisomal membrane protein 11A n=1 Tax=Iris pallida TaxID=29817 RepID=A0AAX6EV32_IRIPA|nr:peroxisomal membrane protein 11A [Iris pallida]KAJ6807771.1 peroxisomal membrane protein 11A [Iris pallida]